MESNSSMDGLAGVKQTREIPLSYDAYQTAGIAFRTIRTNMAMIFDKRHYDKGKWNACYQRVREYWVKLLTGNTKGLDDRDIQTFFGAFYVRLAKLESEVDDSPKEKQYY